MSAPQADEKATEPQPNPTFTPKVGQWVAVRSAKAIIATLDQHGCLDGLPFMPEMIPLCGKQLRIKRFANKTCVNADSVYIGTLENCVILQSSQRCDGAAHGGCEMGCQFIWKTDWLVELPENHTAPPTETPTDQDIDQATNHRIAENAFADKANNKYRCQQTELVQIANPIGPLKLKQYIDDNRRDNISIFAITSFLCSLVTKKLFRQSDSLAGPHPKRTPTQTLALQVGQRVRVKSLEQIRETLDVNGSNRGLWFDPKEMGDFCGKEMVVSRKITKLIDEKTGFLRQLKEPTVVLSETECSGVFRRFCSRGMLHFWREIWLEEVSQ